MTIRDVNLTIEIVLEKEPGVMNRYSEAYMSGQPITLPELGIPGEYYVVKESVTYEGREVTIQEIHLMLNPGTFPGTLNPKPKE